MSGFGAAVVPGKRRLVSLKPADTNEATIFTAGPYGATVLAVVISNNTGTAANATVRWRDDSASTDWDIIATKSVGVNDTLYINEAVFPLRESDLIKVTSGTGNALTFTVLVAEPLSALQQ